jgi:hypothetical protein
MTADRKAALFRNAASRAHDIDLYWKIGGGHA